MAGSAKLGEYAAKQTQFNDRLGKAIDGVVADVKFLKEQIDKLQNSSGEISDEDQKTLDQLSARAQEVVDKAEALDNLTPPQVPTDTGGGTPS